MENIKNQNINLIIETVKNSVSKSEVFKKLNCTRNAIGIKFLNELIEQQNLKIGSNIIKSDLTVCCPFCQKNYNVNGILYHIRYCKQNPNHEINYNKGNHGATKGYIAWNKGLTKDIDERVRQNSETLHQRYKSGEIIPPWQGKKHTEETKEKIRKSMNKFFEEHGNPGWNSMTNTQTPSYPEKYFLKYFLNNNIPLKYHLGVGSYQLDFYNKELKKYIEIDGEQHYRDDTAKEHDRKRTEVLLAKGWVGMRIRWSKFKKYNDEEKEELLNEIKKFLNMC